MSTADNNKGQHDGATQRDSEQRDWLGNAISSVILGNEYNPPSEKSAKEDYDKGFNNAYHNK